jgi:hypothetical protein
VAANALQASSRSEQVPGGDESRPANVVDHDVDRFHNVLEPDDRFCPQVLQAFHLRGGPDSRDDVGTGVRCEPNGEATDTAGRSGHKHSLPGTHVCGAQCLKRCQAGDGQGGRLGESDPCGPGCERPYVHGTSLGESAAGQSDDSNADRRTGPIGDPLEDRPRHVGSKDSSLTQPAGPGIVDVAAVERDVFSILRS